MRSYRVRDTLHEDLVAHLLLARGIEPHEHDAFVHPDFERDSHDPFLLPDMAAAVDRIHAAQKNGETVAVWSDYDCDGVPGGVMLSKFLRSQGLTVIHYIPHRHKEGYGLNPEGIEELKEKGVSLIITVDLGTSEARNIAFAKERGIDTIVTDHHLVHEVPGAYAFINPKRADSKYPFDGLCGAGVAWKLVQALLIKQRPDGFGEGQEKWLLDLVGMATLSDMVPLRGENRMLAYFGVRVLRRARRPGLAALLKLNRIVPSALTEDDVAFMLAPRINAASRMDTPQLAADLLTEDMPSRAEELARELEALNNERKGLVAATVREVNKRVAESNLVESPIIVMGNPNWRPGILGLVANSLVEAHGKPVFLWGREGGEELRGSVRSDGVVNVVELMSKAPELFREFGGHHYSGGFSVIEERVHELLPRLRAAHATTTPLAPEPALIDRELDFSEVAHTHKALRDLAPFGTGFEKPLFMLPKIAVRAVRRFGKAQNHTGATFEREGENIEGIAFFVGPESFSKPLKEGEKVDVVGHVESDWRGRARLRIVDIL